MCTNSKFIVTADRNIKYEQAYRSNLYEQLNHDAKLG